jgi:hypothetical protein
MFKLSQTNEGFLMALSACLQYSADGLSLHSSTTIRNAPKASAQAEDIRRYASATPRYDEKFLEALGARARLAEWPRNFFSSRYPTTPSICSTTREPRFGRVVIVSRGARRPANPGTSGGRSSPMIGRSVSASVIPNWTCSKHSSATSWTTCWGVENRIAGGNLP